MPRSNIKSVVADCEYLGGHRQLIDRLRVRLSIGVQTTVMASEHGGSLRWPSHSIFDVFVAATDDHQSRGRIITFLLLQSRTEGLGVSELKFWFENEQLACEFATRAHQILTTAVHREPPTPPRQKP